MLRSKLLALWFSLPLSLRSKKSCNFTEKVVSAAYLHSRVKAVLLIRKALSKVTPRFLGLA